MTNFACVSPEIGITQQKTDQSFWRGFGGRNRPPIGGLGENPPILLASLITNKLPITHYQCPMPHAPYPITSNTFPSLAAMLLEPSQTQFLNAVFCHEHWRLR
ncbi:hypothetical protein NIES3275_06020 [Microchaete diplosiphon NIES-3275]|nr:hypothetical protein NIES3275_06020 [Microchaete diplosiphon NIES-3275]